MIHTLYFPRTRRTLRLANSDVLQRVVVRCMIREIPLIELVNGVPVWSCAIDA